MITAVTTLTQTYSNKHNKIDNITIIHTMDNPNKNKSINTYNTLKTIKIIQINLGKGREALDLLGAGMIDDGVAIALVQEPYTRDGRLPSMGRSFSIHQSLKPDVRNKTALIANNALVHVTTMDKLTTENVTVCKLVLGKNTTYFLSAYFGKDDNIVNSLSRLDRIFQKIDPSRTLVCVDTNAKSTTWFNRFTDVRGRIMEEWINEHELFVLNCEDVPTFSGHQGTSHIDLTICGGNMISSLHNWHVSPDETLSDHNKLRLTFKSQGKRTNRTSCTLNFKKANWKKFNAALVVELDSNQINPECFQACSSSEELDRKIKVFYEVIQGVSNTTIPATKVKAHSSPWWTTELKKMSNRLNALKKRHTKCKVDTTKAKYYIEYKYYRSLYKKEIRKAKTQSWIRFCSVENSSDVYTKIYKLFKKNKSVNNNIDTLETEDGMIVDDPVLVQKHIVEHYISHNNPSALDMTFNNDKIKPFTVNELSNIIGKLDVKKAGGPDKIAPRLIKEIYKHHKHILLNMFNSCLENNYFPTVWKNANLIFIRKDTVDNSQTINSFRPICLLNTLGKIFERLVLSRLKFEIADRHALQEHQHGFLEGKSVITAGEQVMDFAKKGLRSKDEIILISLDVSGAFNNVIWDHILNDLKEREVPGQLCNLVRSYFRDREIRNENCNNTMKRKVLQGCPQGSVLGPFLWTIIMDNLLKSMKTSEVCRVVAFADDLMIAIKGKNKKDIESLADEQFATITKWGEKYNMKINPTKSKILHISNKIKKLNPVIKLHGERLPLAKEITYLGIKFDSNLNFNNHIKSQCIKARKLLNRLAVVARQTWGLRDKYLMTLYKGVLEPIMLYGYQLWGDCCEAVRNKKTLISTQRLAAVRILRAYKTTNTYTAIYLSGLLPITFKIEALYNVYKHKSDKCIRINNRNYKIESIAKPKNMNPADTPMVNILPDHRNPTNIDYSIYTDGSKIGSHVGSAYTMFKNGIEVCCQKFKLTPHSSVYQAELWAIYKALQRLYLASVEKETYLVVSDSLSSLKSIRDIHSKSKIVQKIHRLLGNLTDNRVYILFKWVKAHMGNKGNERADQLAKSATSDRTRTSYNRIPLSAVKHVLLQQAEQKSKLFYEETEIGNIKNFFPQYDNLRYFLQRANLSYKYVQFLTEHGKFKAYLNRFKITDNSDCSCGDGVRQTAQHLIFDCAKQDRNRTNLRTYVEQKSKRGWPSSSSDLVDSAEGIKIFGEFINKAYENLLEEEVFVGEEDST